MTLQNFAALDEIGQQREGEIPETNSFREIGIISRCWHGVYDSADKIARESGSK